MPEKIKLVLVIEDGCIELVETNVQNIDILVRENDQESSDVYHHYSIPDDAFRFDPTSAEFDKVELAINIENAKEERAGKGYEAYLLKARIAAGLVKPIAHELDALNYTSESGGMEDGTVTFDFDENKQARDDALDLLVKMKELFPSQIKFVRKISVHRKTDEMDEQTAEEIVSR